MYYVNPFFGKPEQPLELLVRLLTIPDDERSLHDHEIIFKCLDNNVMLNEIQRNKSLNVRLNVVAHLSIRDSLLPPDSEFRVVEKLKIKRQMEETKKIRIQKQQKLKDEDLKNLFQTSLYFIVIQNQKLEELFLNKNQRNLRNHVEILKQFTLLQQMEYSQLLHLAFYMNFSTFQYKDYVYKEGDHIEWIYFILTGEFSLQKTFEDKTFYQSKMINKKKSKKKFGDSPLNKNRSNISTNKPYKIGMVEGNCGQSLGDQEIIGDQTSYYSVRCESTQNQIIKVPKQIFKNVINNPKTLNSLILENERKIRMKKQMFRKILQTKNNYKQITRKISQQAEEVELRANKNSLETINEEQTYPLRKNHQNLPYFSIHQEDKEKHSVSIVKKHELENSTISYHENGRYDKNKNRSSFQSFQLTDHARQNKFSHSIVLPSLHFGRKKKVAENTAEALMAEHWSASRPSVCMKNVRKKQAQMVDSTILVQEKQHIISKRVLKDSGREGIFPLEYIGKPRRKVEQKNLSTKKQYRELRSPVHSRDYMENLLSLTMKKAGYSSQKQKKQMKEKEQKELKKLSLHYRNKSSILALEESQFDQCYFNPL